MWLGGGELEREAVTPSLQRKLSVWADWWHDGIGGIGGIGGMQQQQMIEQQQLLGGVRRFPVYSGRCRWV